MTIHHSTRKKAESIGVVLTEAPQGAGNNFPNATFDPNVVQAHWPKHNLYAFGAGEKPARAAVAEIEALIKIKDMNPSLVIVNDTDDPFLVHVFINSSRSHSLSREPVTPTDALLLLDDEPVAWVPTTTPSDGGEAHRAGFPITDNPYDPETDEDDYTRWDEEWENSADEADAEDEEDDSSGSVVKTEYRIRYAEQGHPNHCGDWLAVTLNSMILGKTQTDLEKFEELCGLNGVDLSKYNRTTNGWQGRLRMTGRNLLARKIYMNDGVLLVPPQLQVDGVDKLTAPADWMASQRYKMPKAELAAKDKQGKSKS